ncbi:HNH endonuclease signature motif containing protein, partial [Acinetobacter baumannii]
TSGWKELRDLLQKQEFKCPYTGDTIVIGENASLDHITPSSRGGQSTIDNLQWVTATVNNAKRDLNHDEFVELIVKIANN